MLVLLIGWREPPALASASSSRSRAAVSGTRVLVVTSPTTVTRAERFWITRTITSGWLALPVSRSLIVAEISGSVLPAAGTLPANGTAMSPFSSTGCIGNEVAGIGAVNPGLLVALLVVD